MIHPDTELRWVNSTVGYGVFATNFIPEGTITYVKDMLEVSISADNYLLYDKNYKDIIDKYSFIDEKGNRIISWDHAKFVNHCCNCNTMSTGYGFEIAIRDIYPGEQITDEYGLFNVEYEMDLSCGYENCRKRIRMTDFDTYYKDWDKKLKKIVLKSGALEQPLMKFIDGETMADLKTYLKTGRQYKSLLHLRYKPELVEAASKIHANGNNGKHQ
jgi:SET domain-containing protein